MRRTQRAGGQCRGRGGQSLTEFALIVPLFFILLFGILDFGRLFTTQITLQNALREAGRFAVTGQQGSQSSREASIIQKVQQVSGLPVTVNISSTQGGAGNAGGAGDTVTISLTYTLRLITPFIAKFFPAHGYTFTVSTTIKNEPFTQTH